MCSDFGNLMPPFVPASSLGVGPAPCYLDIPLALKFLN